MPVCWFAIPVRHGQYWKSVALTSGYGQDSGARSSNHGSKVVDEAGPGGPPEKMTDGVFKPPIEYAKLIEPHLGVHPWSIWGPA